MERYKKLQEMRQQNIIEKRLEQMTSDETPELPSQRFMYFTVNKIVIFFTFSLFFNDIFIYFN